LEELAKIKLYYLPELDTLDLWLEDPSSEASSEPLSENLIIKLNSKGEVVGLEIISLSKLEKQDLENLPPKLKETLLASLKKISTQSLQLT
jgi:uncharacterized protein YuzE